MGETPTPRKDVSEACIPFDARFFLSNHVSFFNTLPKSMPETKKKKKKAAPASSSLKEETEVFVAGSRVPIRVLNRKLSRS